MYVKSTQVMIFTLQSDLTSLTADNGQLALCLDVLKLFYYNGTTWLPFATTNVKKSTATVTGTGSTSQTLIYTMEASTLKFYPLMVVFRAVNISGVTTPPTVSIGTNATSYNNIAAGTLLTTLLSTLGAGNGVPQTAISTPVIGGAAIYANVTIAGLATSYTFNVEIVGFYDV